MKFRKYYDQLARHAVKARMQHERTDLLSAAVAVAAVWV
jgi:hypothetical protein